MGWSNSNTISGGGGGGGTTINPTNGRVPVRANSSTFIDAQIFCDLSSTPANLQLLSANNYISIDWENKLAYDFATPSQIESIDWGNRFLNDQNGSSSVDWGYRQLNGINGISLSYEGSNIKTSSDIFQNDFAVSVGLQNTILQNANFSQRLWWSGHTIYASVSDTVTEVGSLVSFIPPFGGIWVYSDFTLENSRSTNILGIYLGNNLVLLDGHIVAVSEGVTSNFPTILNMSVSANLGSVVYGTAGTPKFNTNEPVASGNVKRRLGHTYYNDGSNYYLMFFRPSNDWSVVP